MNRAVYWASILVYGGFGAVFALISLHYLRRDPKDVGPGVAAAAGALYSFLRMGIILVKGRRSTS